MSTIPKIDYLLLEMVRDTDIVLPSMKENSKDQKYAGAIVLEPQVGLHENVIVVDFASLYPSCYTTFNISPETVHTPEEYDKLDPDEKEKCFKLEHDDEVGGHLVFYINGQDEGILPTAVKHLYEQRLNYKSLRKKEKNKHQKQLYDNIEKTYKILLNACYGAFGNRFFRLYSLPVAECVTCAARMMLLSASDYIRRNYEGTTIVYGDTDSLFIKFEDTKTHQESIDKAQNICDEYNNWLRTYYINSINPYIKKKDIPQKLDVDKSFTTLYVSAKKRYIGKDKNGNDSFKGIEMVRSDYFVGLKPMLQGLIDKILVDKLRYEDLEQAFNSLYNMPIEELGVNKRFTRKFEDFAVETQALKGAKFANEYLGEEISNIDEPLMFYTYCDIERMWKLERIKTREDLDEFCALGAICVNDAKSLERLDYIELDYHTLFFKMILEKLRAFEKIEYMSGMLDHFYAEHIEPIFDMRKEMRARILRKLRLKIKKEKG